ncbi:MAG: winged helix-turn-helix domain-containing protein [Patescibacteria group bacterium]|nr:winged helix-turn-helix domain-containing protein [Patescibacteria group bacterium]
MLEQLFGSRTRVKVLALLLNNPTRSYYVREITRKVDEQINSVRRELANLKAVGLVRSRAKKGKVYYQANSNSDLFPHLKKIFGKVAKETVYENKIAESIKTAGTIQYASLHGYFVEDPSSPIDLFIVGTVDKAKMRPVVRELSKEVGHEINYTVMDPEEFTERRLIFDRFLTEVLSSSKIVVVDYLGLKKEE